jgi:hypothetical protein
MRAPDTFIAGQRGQHGNSLNGFPETHLVSEDAIKFFVMKSYKPIQTNNLVLSERTMKQEWYFGLYVGTREVSTCRLKAFCHLDSLLSN